MSTKILISAVLGAIYTENKTLLESSNKNSK
jgi:hypothetical protein